MIAKPFMRWLLAFSFPLKNFSALFLPRSSIWYFEIDADLSHDLLKRRQQNGHHYMDYSHTMKKIEYSEGPKAKEKFERTMTALFRVPKSADV